MEEILASIRRIISEDEPAAEAAPPAPEPAPEPMAAEAMPVEAEEVLELTDPLPEPEPERVETHGDLEVHEIEPEPEPEPVRMAEPARMPEPVMAADIYDEPLVSDPTADQTASSFGHLARSIAMPKAGRTLEDVVGEMLRPLLKAWLDEHLPTIVQAKVEEEVERIARRRVG
jgi:uncharacterized protein